MKKSYIFAMLTDERESPVKCVEACFIASHTQTEAAITASNVGLYLPYESKPLYLFSLPRLVAWLLSPVIRHKIAWRFNATSGS